MNILSIFTITVVVLMTGYSLYQVHLHKNKLTSISGMIIAITIATMAGLLSGYLIAILTGDMFLSGGIGVILGFMIGFLAGQPFGILAVLNGSISGLMSGILGSVFGVMLGVESPYIMLGILLVIYIIIFGLVILFIEIETNDKLSLDTQAISPFTIISVGVVLISLLLFLYSSDFIKTPSGQTTTQSQTNDASINSSSKVTELDVTKEPTPVIKMEATATGYTPNLIHVKKGVQVKLEIHNPLENSCLSTFNMPDFNINNVNLKAGTTRLTFTPTKKGEYTFSCGMNMYKGKIIVE